MSSGSDTMSLTGSRGLSDAYGSWKTICRSRRALRSCAGLSLARSSPFEHDDAAGRLGEAQQRAAGGRLAAPRLPHQTERLARPQVEADVADRLHRADDPPDDAGAAHRELLDEVPHRQDRLDRLLLGCRALGAHADLEVGGLRRDALLRQAGLERRAPRPAKRRRSPGRRGPARRHQAGRRRCGRAGRPAPRRLRCSRDGLRVGRRWHRRSRLPRPRPRSSVHRWQAARWSALLVTVSSGSISRHTSATSGQRGENGHPGGRFTSDGGAPWIGVSISSSTSSRGSEPSSPSV